MITGSKRLETTDDRKLQKKYEQNLISVPL